MSVSERPYHRRNNTTKRAGLSRVAEDLTAMRVTTPTPPPSIPGPSMNIGSARRRKSRSPGSTRYRPDGTTIGTTISTVVSKKRKSSASASSVVTNIPDEPIIDRGRKTKLKTQSRYSVENSTSAAEQLPPPPPHIHRLNKKQRSKSRDSKERNRKHPLSDTSRVGEKSSTNSAGASSSAASELSRVKKELDALKKVIHYFLVLSYPLTSLFSKLLRIRISSASKAKYVFTSKLISYVF
jgi:hypothetical protein